MANNGHEMDKEDSELAGLVDYEVGFKARVYGEPFDPEATFHWKRGWHAAAANAADRTGDDD